MSAITMRRTCIHCQRQYTYNPSVGRFGLVCPHCGKVQDELIATPTEQNKSAIGNMVSMVLKNDKTF